MTFATTIREGNLLLGWQPHGRVVYEWIQSLKGPTVYADQI